MTRVDVDAPDTELALLRAPATIAVAAFVGGLTVGELGKAISGQPFASMPYWFAIVVCAPFLFPSRWFGDRSSVSVVRAWLLIAAVLATLRLAYFCAWAYSQRPLTIWFVMLLLDLAVAVALWVAAYALLWRVPGRLTPEERAWRSLRR
jgi:hypothetical protein